MPKQVKEPASYRLPLALAVAAAFHLVLAFVSTVWDAVSNVLWVPVLGAGLVWMALFLWLHAKPMARRVLRGVWLVFAAAVVALLAWFAYGVLGQGAFEEDVLGWVQMTVCYVYASLICLLPAATAAALCGARFDVWSFRVTSLLTLALGVYLTAYEAPQLARIVHPTDAMPWLLATCVAAAVQTVLAFCLKINRADQAVDTV